MTGGLVSAGPLPFAVRAAFAVRSETSARWCEALSVQRFAVAVVVQSKGFVDLAVVNLCVGAHLYIGAWICDRRLVFAGRLGGGA